MSQQTDQPIPGFRPLTVQEQQWADDWSKQNETLWCEADSFFQENMMAEANDARRAFPSTHGKLAALMEEVGELAKALLSESDLRVREEAVQVAVLAMRIAVEGDASLGRDQSETHDEIRIALMRLDRPRPFFTPPDVFWGMIRRRYVEGRRKCWCMPSTPEGFFLTAGSLYGTFDPNINYLNHVPPGLLDWKPGDER